MKKKILIILMLMCLMSVAFSQEKPDHIEEAEALESMGLFKGTDQGFELERQASRTEAIIMLIRLIGEEEAALNYKSDHPFTDVAKWADTYVAYAYDKGLTNGLSDHNFGADDNVSSAQFITFVLRALGYDDRKGDFVWNQALAFAQDKHLLSDLEEEKYTSQDHVFLRDDCAMIAYKALSLNKNGSDQSLVEYLTSNQAVDEEVALSLGLTELQIKDLTLDLSPGDDAIIKGSDFSKMFPEAVSVSYLTTSAEDEEGILAAMKRSYQYHLFKIRDDVSGGYNLNINLSRKSDRPQMLMVYSADQRLISHVILKDAQALGDSVTFIKGAPFDEDMVRDEAYAYTEATTKDAVFFDKSLIDLSKAITTNGSRTDHSIDLKDFDQVVGARTTGAFRGDDVSNPDHVESMIKLASLSVKTLDGRDGLPLKQDFSQLYVTVDKNYNPSVIVLFDAYLNIIAYTFVDQ